jgi:hypothetical protein
MAKDTFYFKHDYNSRNDPKLVELKRVLGSVGKGIYWDLIEMLHEQGGKLAYNISAIAYELREQEDVINRVINEFDLFKKDEKYFWSDRAKKNLKEREKLSKAASDKALKRWNGNAGALPQQSHGNARKGEERKGNKRKGKNIEFIPPSLDEVVAFFQEKGYRVDVAHKAFEYYNAADWKDSKGSQVKNWKQKMIAVWFKDENKQGSGSQKQMVY